MRKTFFIYKGLIITEVLWLLMVGGLLYAIFIYGIKIELSFERVAGLVLGLALCLVILWNAITRLSYTISIKENYLIERGIFSKKRWVLLSEITRIKRREHNLLFDSRGQKSFIVDIVDRIRSALFWLSRGRAKAYSSIAMLDFVGGPRNFPRFPINPKIVDSLIQLKPKISVDQNVADLLTTAARKKLKLKLTVVERIGLWVWRIVVGVLILLVLGIVLFPLGFRLLDFL